MWGGYLSAHACTPSHHPPPPSAPTTPSLTTLTRAQRANILGRLEIGAPGFEEPQRCVGGVVFRAVAGAGKYIGEHSLADEAREGRKDSVRDLRPPGRQRQARQADHGVA